MKRLDTLERFDQIISPISWLVLNSAVVLMFAIVLQPGWWEVTVALIADFLAFLLMRWIDRRLFIRFFPDVLPYFLDARFPNLEKTTLEERLSIFNSMVRFPKRRALYCTAISYLKGIPAYLIVVFFWQHEVSNGVQLLKVLGLVNIVYAYFYGAVFIESHGLISKKIGSFHERYDWTEVFRRTEVPFYKSEFEIQEVLAFTAIWVYILLLQIILLLTNPTSRPPLLFAQWAVVSLVSFGLFSRLWYLSRRYLQGGLQGLFHTLEQFDPEKFQKTLPLHSSPLIARFEKTINSLILRLRSYKNELARWTFIRAEESRLRALGEISSLIVHDLSSPLHVIQFCATELKSHPDRIHDARYLDQLVLNGERALSLVNSLRSYLRNPVSDTLSSSYKNAHEHVVRLLETQFRQGVSQRVTFQVDPRMWSLKFRLSIADLIHLLFNFFKNSIENYMLSFPSIPRIDVGLEATQADEITFSIRDYGTGLSHKRFEELTGWDFIPSDGKQSREGLGLRLVRRLVERNGGNIRVAESIDESSGTSFLITLKRSDEVTA